MKRPSLNPFNNHGFSYEAWEEGYKSPPTQDVSNPYSAEAGDLREFWEEGRQARQRDIKDIPPGMYCYTSENNVFRTCPYWSSFLDVHGDPVGFCSYLNLSDEFSGDLLYDKIKSCSEKDDYEDKPEWRKFLIWSSLAEESAWFLTPEISIIFLNSSK